MRQLDLSILIPIPSNAVQTCELLERLPIACARLPQGVTWEVVVALPTHGAPSVESVLAKLPAGQGYRAKAGYGASLRQALELARGQWILTMESGLAHSPFIIPELFARREDNDLVVASRYTKTGYDNAGWFRSFVARWSNRLVATLLDLPVHDLSSSFRLYRRRVFDEAMPEHEGFGALLEVLVRSFAAGFRVAEVPFHYFPIHRGTDSTFWQVAREYLGALRPLWRLRNSIDCADYDERAFRSRIWFQRSWQRWRYHALVGMVRECPRILDIGCGSSQVLEGLPQADGCDIRLNKLRYKRGRSGALVRASVFDLPFKSEAYDAAIFSQVIEHLPRNPKILQEVVRVVRPGGIVVVGTPDYATWWTTIEKIYGFVHPTGYADEHITHYTFETLKAEVEGLGCEYLDHAYVYGAELIMRFRKNG
ncbi:MAG: methyltransferase domain-containing protein [Candidatus Hydrogenedentota bacterium]|jgi:SAM-dependent methyltransferase|nr:MAG: methyltransferase domain-containing protein [Candidatus Hydrogenedentota bacterium]